MQTRKRSRNPGKSIKKACYICQNLKILNFSVSYTEKDRSNATKVIFSNISGDKGIKYDKKVFFFKGYFFQSKYFTYLCKKEQCPIL